MKPVLVLLFLFAQMLLSAQESGYSQMKDIAAFKKGLDKIAVETNTIQTKFTQEKHISMLTKSMVSEGNMIFKKPDKVKWAYEKPYSYIIVLKDKKISVNDEGKVNTFDLSQSAVFKEINELIVNSVSGNMLDEQRFTISYFESRDLYLIRLIPKNENLKKYLAEIKVYFERTDLAVFKIQMIESATDYTEINFRERRLNEPVSDEAFKVH